MFLFKVSLLLILSLAFWHIGSCKTITIKENNNSRIVGGTNATKYQFPHFTQVVATLKGNGTKELFGNCGGSIISPTFILTAAHCVANALSVNVISGFHTIYDLRDARKHTIKSIRIHENYNSTQMIDDVALIELMIPIKFTDAIKPIQISCNYTQSAVPTLAAGTGKTSDVGDALSTSLQWTNLTTISNEQCGIWFGTIGSSNLCAVGKRKHGACQGDSGTALVKKVNETYMQVGTLSWGVLGRCERGYPTVYARLTSYVDWIKQHSDVSCVNE